MAIFIVMALSWLSLTAQVAAPPAGAPQNADSLGVVMPRKQPITVSLVTCYPGPEIYELYGHTALRVRGEGIDSVWNFGVFDFRQPNFVYRFVKGETDYMCASYPFEYFLPEYVKRGSKVVEQDLNLTQSEARSLHAMLRENALPENRVYRYNYVKDNCSTRPRDIIEKTVGVWVTYPDTVLYGTFRNEMRHYNRNYPWYQLGIDLALGMGIDGPITAREEAFVPVELKRQMADARFSDGRKAVTMSRVLNEGVADATLPPTPWYLSPRLWCWLIGLTALFFCIRGIHRKEIPKLVYSIWFFAIGIIGCVVAFLVFMSSHEATSPNMQMVWFNPLQLVFAVAVWSRRMEIVARIMAWYNVAGGAFLLIVWPFQPQMGNPTLEPIVLGCLVLGASYLIIVKKRKAMSIELARTPHPAGDKGRVSSRRRQ